MAKVRLNGPVRAPLFSINTTGKNMCSVDKALTKAKTNKDKEAGMVETNKEMMQFSFTEESGAEEIKGIMENDMSLSTDGPNGPLLYLEPVGELGLRLMDEEDPPMGQTNNLEQSLSLHLT